MEEKELGFQRKCQGLGCSQGLGIGKGVRPQGWEVLTTGRDQIGKVEGQQRPKVSNSRRVKILQGFLKLVQVGDHPIFQNNHSPQKRIPSLQVSWLKQKSQTNHMRRSLSGFTSTNEMEHLSSLGRIVLKGYVPYIVRHDRFINMCQLSE